MKSEENEVGSEQSYVKPLAVVTGASSGIGRALAHEFAQHGFDLVIAAENAQIEDAAQELRTDGAFVEALQVDLATDEGVQSLYEKIQNIGRPVDAIAINAGVGVYGDFARESELKDELNLIQLNVVSSVHLAKLMLKDMVSRRQGRVLFTSSIASKMPGPMYAVYAASKAFIQSFSEAIREELKDSGVTVTALLPGATETDFFDRAGMQETKVGQAKKDDPAQVARQGFEALMGGKDKVVGGSFMNKIQAATARILPEPVQAKVHGSALAKADDSNKKKVG